MKSLEELISRFNDIQDLPVSEEMLGAYAEGTLQGTELDAVSDKISSDSGLQEMLNSATETNIEDMADASHPWDIHEGDYGYWELGLPPILSPSDITSEDNGGNIAGFSVDGDRISDENTLSIQNPEESVGDNTLNSNIMANNEKKVFGYESNANKDKFDQYIYQGQQPTCAIRSQEIILRDYGISIPQEELIEFACQNGWYDPDPKNGGTPQDAVGNILEACGIPTLRTENATIYDIIAELRAGHRVIVSLDAQELWVKNQPFFKKTFGEFQNKVQDVIDRLNGVQGANHALIVAGVKVNPHDASDVCVTLIDPGTGDVCIEYKLEDFQDALEDSNSYMVSTTLPAPYQYNYETHEMEPSSFYTEYIPSMSALPMQLNNEFNLDESYYDKYAEYQPVYDVIRSTDDNSDIENDDAYNDTSLYKTNDEDDNDEDNNLSPYFENYDDENKATDDDGYNIESDLTCDTNDEHDDCEIAPDENPCESMPDADC